MPITIETKELKGACEKLDVVQRVKVAEAAVDGRENPIEGEAAKEFYCQLMKMDQTDRYDLLEGLQYELTTKIIEDNFQEWLDS